MDTHMFLITRYSILSRRRNYSWNIPLDLERQKELVFSTNRLSLHEHLFSALTLPSIRNQKKLSEHTSSFTYIVCVSEELPERNMSRLEEVMEGIPYAKIVKMPLVDDVSDAIEEVVKSELQQFKSPIVYATARLDDDDALSRNYLDVVNGYLEPEYEGFALSFARGYEAVYDERKKGFRWISEMYYPKTAVGLCYVNIFNPKSDAEGPYSIHGLRAHNLIDRKVPCVLDARENMILRTRHKGSITSMKGLFEERVSVRDRAKGVAKRVIERRKMNRRTRILIESGCIDDIADMFGFSANLFVLDNPDEWKRKI